MTKTFFLLAASGSLAIAAVPVQFTAGSVAKADEINKNFGFLDTAKASKQSVEILTSAIVAKIDAADANSKLGAKVDTGAYNKYVREQASKSVTDTSSKRRIDSLAAATKTVDDGLGKRVGVLESKPGSIANDTAGVKDWTSKYFPGTVPVSAIKGQGATDFGAAAFMRREPGTGSSVLDFHTDGVIDSWKTEGGIQTNSVTRIDGNGNGFFSTVQAGTSPVAYGKSAMTVQAAGDNWEQGLEILPSPDGAAVKNSGWGGIFLRSAAGSKTGSWAILRSPTSEFNIMLEGIGSRVPMEGTLNVEAPLSIDLYGNTYLGGSLSVRRKILASNAEITDLRVAGSIKTAPTEPWADYVFEPGYKAMALKDVETFAKANGHLPEVPSAAEVAKDGIDLARMNAILLKKIEELTLHAVEQEKKMEALQAEVREMKTSR